VLPLHHGTGSQTQNLGFVVEIGGAKVLHVGDTEASAADLAPHGLYDAGIDVALLPVWFYSYPSFDASVRALRARRLVAFHVAPADAPAEYHGAATSFDELVRLVDRRAPGVELLTRAGQSLVVTPAVAR
jgi:L-ascorbate metabolism protein UlaG (beta-lactamase superfamily)